MKKPTICLTFICKNNETTIGDMIDSCFPFIDEIIACDTGSTDKTIGIIDSYCKKIPITIRRHEWKNFGHNRTLMMKEAAKSACNYLLVMDTDETLICTKIKQVFPILQHDVIMIKTVSGAIEYYRDRMFKNEFDWYWKGYAHEFPTTQGYFTKQVLDYFQLELRSKDGNAHIERNYNLLLQEEADGQATSRTYFYLGQSAKYLEKIDEAVKHYEMCIKETFWNEEKFYAYYDMGRITKLKEHFDNAYKTNPNRAESLYQLAIVYRQEEKYTHALFALNTASTIKIPKNGLFVERAVYKYLIDFELSINLYYLERYEESFEYATKVNTALRTDDNMDEGVYNQNNINIAYTRRKLVEKGNLDVLVIELPTGYDGLGDHLFFSHLPELAKKKGFKKVFISNANTYKTEGTKEAVWESNPYVDRFTDERGTYANEERMERLLRGNTQYPGMPFMKQITVIYEVYAEEYNCLPILYMYGRKSVFDKIKVWENKDAYTLFDGNWKSWCGLSQRNIDKYFAGYSIKSDEIFHQMPDINGKALMCNLADVKILEPMGLKEYILYIAGSSKIICLMSGSSVVSAALMRKCIVLDGNSTNLMYKFPEINTYLNISYNA